MLVVLSWHCPENPGTVGDRGGTMMTTRKEDAKLVRRSLIDVVATEAAAAIDILHREDATDSNSGFENGQRQEQEAAQGWQVVATATVDLDIDDVITAGERVAIRRSVSGIDRESLLDRAPTGTPFEITDVSDRQGEEHGELVVGHPPRSHGTIRCYLPDYSEPIDDCCNRTPVIMIQPNDETPDASSSEQTTTTTELIWEVTESDGTQ